MTHANALFDTIVIGAGYNGLVAAAYLARQGKRVCIVERSQSPGGMAQTRTLANGSEMPRIAHLASALHPKVLKELRLLGDIVLKDVPTTVLSPDGNHLVLSAEGAQYADGRPHADSDAYMKLRKRIVRFASALNPLTLRPPPDLTSMSNLDDIAALAKAGLGLRFMGKTEAREFLRVVLSNAADLILDEMPDGPLAGGLAADAIWGAWAGPRSPGTVFSLMYRYGVSASAMVPVGGMGEITHSLVSYLRGFGTEIRTGTEVAKVLSRDDSVQGVVLDTGETLEANAVLSSLGPMASMKMAGVEHFDTEAVRRVRNVRSKGMTAKLNLLLKARPDFAGLDLQYLRGRLLVAPSVQGIEAAFNAAKYGDLPKEPVLEIVLPGLMNAGTNEADGAQTMSIVAQYIPYKLTAGWDDAAREELTATVLTMLENYAPGISDLVETTESLSPMDIERETGAAGGHWHHCELSTDQLLNVRPVNGMSQYAFGLKGYYLCGASTHPGGNVSGVPGRNAALQLIKDGVLR